VVTTLFPLYDFARSLLGPVARVTLVLPPGMEPHSYEPTPQDVVRMRTAAVFVYTGPAMEPWVAGLAGRLDDDGVRVVEASQGIPLMGHDPEDDHDDGETGQDGEDAHAGDDEHGDEELDPHVWLDPTLAARMVTRMADAFVEAFPVETDGIRTREAELHRRLDELDRAFLALFERTDQRTLLYGGHSAFRYFGLRYGLTFVSPYPGFSPSAEPTVQRLVELGQILETLPVRTIFHEELVDPRVAAVLAEKAGARLVLLHGGHNVSPAEMEAGATYFSIMEDNLLRLEEGLGLGEPTDG